MITHRVAGLKASSELLVEKEARELCSAGSLKELNEDLASLSLNLISSLLEGLIAHKVLLVVILLELFKHGL